MKRIDDAATSERRHRCSGVYLCNTRNAIPQRRHTTSWAYISRVYTLRVCISLVGLTGVHLISEGLTGMYLRACLSCACVSGVTTRACTPRRSPHGHASCGRAPHCVYLTGVCVMGTYLIDMHLIDGHLTDTYFMGMHHRMQPLLT
jgi:hypothetical protein